MNKEEKAIYDNMNWWNRAKYDILVQQETDWLQRYKTSKNPVYKQYAIELAEEYKKLLRR